MSIIFLSVLAGTLLVSRKEASELVAAALRCVHDVHQMYLRWRLSSLDRSLPARRQPGYRLALR